MKDMTGYKKISFRTRLLLLVAFIVLVGYAITLAVLSRQAGSLQQKTALQYTAQLATSEGAKVAIGLERALDSARTLAQGLGSLKSAGLADRASADALLKGVLVGNPGFLGVWTIWEPNAFDGKDGEYANLPGHGASGQYVPYWNRGNGSVGVEPLVDYDKPGPGDFYQLAKASGQETVLEPYAYTLAGKSVLMTSLVVPIQIDGRFVGVAGTDLTLASLQHTVEKVRAYGTGYASLLSNNAIYVGDRDAENVGKALNQAKGLDLVRQAIAEGRTLQNHFFDPRLQTDVTRVHVPIEIGMTHTPWSFAITVPNDTVLSEVHQQRLTAIGLGALSTVLVSLVLAFALERMVLRPLGGEPGEAARITARVAHGDLGQPIALGANDSTSLMAHLQGMQNSLASVVAKVCQGADSVATASAQISQGNHDLSARTESQASALEQTAASMEQLSAAVTQNADNARQANALAHSACRVATQGGEAVARVVEAMHGINDSSRKIGDIIGVIDGIAFQTNILALNAAVEAARAGAQGRGFAVVASEVRSLAGRSAEAAKEIKTLIGASMGRAEVGAMQVKQAGQTMTEVVQAIQQVTAIVADISGASAEQSAGVAQISAAITQIDQATQQNAALVEEMAAAASSLQTQAQDLVHTMARFQLGESIGRASPNNGPAGRSTVPGNSPASGRPVRHPAQPLVVTEHSTGPQSASKNGDQENFQAL